MKSVDVALMQNRPDRVCGCSLCGGASVPSSTYYRHNDAAALFTSPLESAVRAVVDMELGSDAEASGSLESEDSSLVSTSASTSPCTTSGQESDSLNSSDTPTGTDESTSGDGRSGDDGDLYDGSSTKVLDAIYVILSLQSVHKHSKRSMRDLFKIIAHMLPPGNKLCSYDKAVAMMKKHKIRRVERYVCCPENDCGLMYNPSLKHDPHRRRQFQGAKKCPVCDAQLYHRDDTTRPIKVFRYIPLVDSLRELFGVDGFSSRVRLSREQRKDGISEDIQDSHAWYDLVLRDEDFMKELRNIVLSFSTDGVPCFKKGNGYSFWPMMVSILNLDPKNRTKYGNLILLGIIPGKHSPKNINTYLAPFVDELLDLWSGVKVHDATCGRDFILRGKLLMTIADLKGHGKVNCMQDSTAVFGCNKCKIETERCVAKRVFGGYRRYLPKDHPYRRDPSFGPPELREPHAVRTHARVVELGKKVRRGESEPGKDSEGITGVSEFCRLSYWDVIKNWRVDIAHACKGVGADTIAMICGDKRPTRPVRVGKQKDKKKHKQRSGRKGEQKSRRRYSRKRVRSKAAVAVEDQDPGEYVESDTTTSATGEDEFADDEDSERDREKRERAEEARLRSQRVRRQARREREQARRDLLHFERSKGVRGGADALEGGMRGYRAGFLSSKRVFHNYKSFRMNMWKNFALCKARYLLRNVLSDRWYKTTVDLFDVIAELHQPQLRMWEAETKKFRAIEVLCRFERDFPVTQHVYVPHALLHLILEVPYWGPPSAYWTYPWESFCGFLTAMIKDRARPAQSATSMYELFRDDTLRKKKALCGLVPLPAGPDRGGAGADRGDVPSVGLFVRGERTRRWRLARIHNAVWIRFLTHRFPDIEAVVVPDQGHRLVGGRVFVNGVLRADASTERKHVHRKIQRRFFEISSRYVVGLEHQAEVSVIGAIQYLFWVVVAGSRLDVARVNLFDPAHCALDAKSELRTYDSRRLLDANYVSPEHIGPLVMSCDDPDGDKHKKYVISVPLHAGDS